MENGGHCGKWGKIDTEGKWGKVGKVPRTCAGKKWEKLWGHWGKFGKRCKATQVPG